MRIKIIRTSETGKIDDLLSVNLAAEDARVVFAELADTLLKPKATKANEVLTIIPPVDAVPPEEVKLVQEDTLGETYKYKGFMHLICPKCGHVRGFCTKDEVSQSTCRSCGHTWDFNEPLYPLYIDCECGAHYKYLTNCKEYAFDINCLNCGTPVAVKWHVAKRIYETIR